MMLQSLKRAAKLAGELITVALIFGFAIGGQTVAADVNKMIIEWRN